MIENLKKTTSLLSIKLKIRFIFLIIFIFIGTSFELLSVALLIPILNILVGNIDDIKSFLAEYKLEILINFISIKNILLLFLIIFIVKSLFRLFLVHYQGNFIFSLHKFLVNKLYKHYILKNYLFHTKNNTSKIIRNLTQEIHSCSIGYMGAITNIIIEVLIILSLMSFLLFYQPSVVLVFIMITGAVSLILVKFLNLISKKLGKKRQKFALINLNTIVNGFGGIKDIIVNNSENLKINNYLFQFLQQVPKIILELIFVISIVILLTYFLQINTPKDEIIVFFGLMIGIFSRVMPSMNKLSSSYVNLSYYKPALDLMHNEIGKISRNNNFKEISKNLNFEKKIELKNITFFYNTKKNTILKNANLTIKKGETIGIYGESGSGKSTLIDIIIGLLEPQKGDVLVDNNNIKKNKKSWFKKIGYVPQSIYLNSDTIKNNIYFYEDKKVNNLKKLKDSLKMSQLNKIALNRNVGERGIQVSGGQKQRIGLARALYKDSNILILDEATSALDKENEENFLKNVFKLKTGKTLIIISHKKSIVDKCDKVITIKNKKIKQI